MMSGRDPAFMNPDTVDLDLLLRLRLAVARFGEMDPVRWWNTAGQLGALGATAIARGFPRTHFFAQARSVFAVASERCRQLFDPPGCVTLWRLTDEIEAEFDSHWEKWIDRSEEWEPFFLSLQTMEIGSLPEALQQLGLVTGDDISSLNGLSTSSEAHSIQLPSLFSGSLADVKLLALGFSRGTAGSPVVPYARLA